MSTKKGYSPYSEKAIFYVQTHPGCCKMDLAKHLTRKFGYDPSKLYRLVNYQIKVGNILAVRKGKQYYLFADEVSLKKWEEK